MGVRRARETNTRDEQERRTTRTKQGTRPPCCWLKILMMSTICNGTKLDLSRLTDEEVKHVWQVIQRDFNLRKTEKDRLSYLKSKIVKEDTKRELLGYQPNFSDSFCISCLQPFKFLLSAKHQCMECKQFVCKSCSCFHKKEQGWVCDPCQMSRVLQIGTLEWFHENLHARFKHFGSAKVMMSIFKRLNAEWNCSQTNLRDKELVLACDTSPYGVGAVLSPVMEEGGWPEKVAYSQRRLELSVKDGCLSPAEMVMSRRLRSTLDLLLPDVKSKIRKKQLKQKEQHDSNSRWRSFSPGDDVYFRNYGYGPKWVPAIIKMNTGPVSYKVQLGDGCIVRRHVDQIQKQHAPRTETHTPNMTLEPVSLQIPTTPEVLPSGSAVSVSVGEEENKSAETGQVHPSFDQPEKRADQPLLLRRSERTRSSSVERGCSGCDMVSSACTGEFLDGPMCSQEDDQSEGLGCEYYRMSRKSKRLLPVDPQDFNIGTEYSIYFQCHSLKNERPDPEVDWTTDFRHIPDHGKYGIGEGKKGIFHISNRRLVIPSDSDDFKNSDNMMVQTHSLSKISHSLSGSANYLEYCELPYSIEDSEEDDVESSQNFMYPGPVSRKCSSDEVAPQITELNKRMSVIETLLGRLEGKMTDEEKSHPSHQVKPAEELLSPVDLEEWELKRRLEELTENISEKGLSSDEDESNKLTEDIKALRIIMRRKSATLDKNSFSCQLQKSNFYKDEPFSTQRILNSYEVNATAGELSQLESKVALTVARVQSTQSDVTDIQNRIAAFNVIRKTTDHWKKRIVILEDRVRSQTVEIWHCHWLQNFISISLCIEIASNDDKPRFSSEGDVATNLQTK
ncbi:uncharacterized protein mlphb [Hoplias malabaricus]|uniref:uncharacterized protein mlphb n=1 Tax=Hoplias malabaricus TaxID=27720 RepID=UPI003462F7E9